MVELKLLRMNEYNNITTDIQLSKEKINKHKFEECIKSNKFIYPFPAGSIDQIFKDKGLLEGTAAHQVLGRSKGFSYCNVLSEFMYV